MNSHFQKDCVEILRERHAQGRISRRSLMQGLGLLLGSSALGMSATRALAADQQLVFVNWGGDAITAMSKSFGVPFTKDTGVAVKYDGSGPTEGAITAQAQSGHPTWDLVDCDPFSGQALGKQGFMEEIDYTIVDVNGQRPGFQWTYASSTYFYSYVLAYSKKAFPTAPTSIKDFFDVETFPGKRAMYKWGAGMWEAALLADGVAPEALYPLDLERAHAKITGFKDHIAAYWGGGAESQSLLLDGEVTMALIWSTRAKVLHEDTDGEISFIWDQAVVAPGSTGVLKNNPGGKDLAMQFINASQTPERQAELFMLMGNGPGNPAADALIPEEQRFFNPADPENFAKQIVLDMEWYEANYSTALDAYLKAIAA